MSQQSPDTLQEIPAPRPKRSRGFAEASKRVRIARPTFAHRIRTEPMLRRIANNPPARWPAPLAHAYSILKDELVLSDAQARTIMQESAKAALACARKVNELRRNPYAFEMQKLFAIECRILGRRIQRLPPAVKTKIDELVSAELRGKVRDSETLLDVLQLTKNEYSRQAEKSAVHRAHQSIERILDAREALDPFACLTLQEALGEVEAVEARGMAARLFAAIGEECEPRSTPMARPLMTQALTDFAAELVQIWRVHGLSPSRGRDPNDPDYQSRFQRFSDMIVTPLLEPTARRYPVAGNGPDDQGRPTPADVSAHIDARRKNNRQAWLTLDETTRSEVGPGLQEQDWRSLVSEHHIRTALKAAPRIL